MEKQTADLVKTTSETSLAISNTQELMQCEGKAFPMVFDRCCKGVAMVDIFKNKYPNLKKLDGAYGNDKTKRRVKMILAYYNELAALQKGLSPPIIERLADMIVDQYPYYNLTLQDLHIALDRGLGGKYSKDGLVLVLNMAVVTSWLDKYFSERCDAAENYNRIEDGVHPSGVGERYTEESIIRFIRRHRAEYGK